MEIHALPGGALRRLLTGAVAGLFLVLAACGTSTTAKTSPLTAAQLIQKGSDNFAQDNALHFTLTASDIAPGLFAVTKAQGDVVRPDKLQIHGIVEATQGFSTGIGIIFVGPKQYVSLGDTGTYQNTSGLPNLLNIFSTSQGIGAILSQLQNPSTPTDDTVNGVECWKITGTVSSTLLAPITGSPPATPTNVQTLLWIGQSDNQIHQVTLNGKATDTDKDTTVRTFDLSNYNETVTITAPPTK